MRWSFALGRIAGIPIRVHVTFLALVAFFAISGGLFAGRLVAAAVSVAAMLVVFACVLLHELGHALAARRYGIRTHDITLLPIGGLARLERMPEKPAQELVVAIAGPAVNVVIFAAVSLLLGGPPWPLGLGADDGVLEWVAKFNAWMVLFNLIPAFPMDGGRVFRALLAMTMPFTRATNIASNVGQFMALVLGTIGVFWTQNPLLVLIALFVFFMAGEERTSVRTRVSLRGLPVRDAMLTEFRTLDATDPLGLAVRYLMAGSQTDFPVLDDRRPVGVLTSAALINGLSRLGPEAPVGRVAGNGAETCEADERLEDVLARVRSNGHGTIPVMSGGALVGLLTLDNVGELMLVRNAIRRFRGDAEA